MQQITTRDQAEHVFATATELVERAAVLNARPWAEVRANYAGLPTNDDVGTVDGDGSEPTAPEEHPHAEAQEAAEAAKSGADGGAGGGADPVLDALQKFSGQIDTRMKAVEQTISRSAPAPGATREQQQQSGEENIGAMSALIDGLDDQYFDDEGLLTADGELALFSVIAEQAVEKTLAPERQAQAEERRDAEAAELEEKYPRLAGGTPEDEAFVDSMIEKTKQFAQQLGRPELAAEPSFFERVYLAHEAEQRIAGETPAGKQDGGAVTLSRGQSAAPAKSSTKDDAGDRIVRLATQSQYRLGRG